MKQRLISFLKWIATLVVAVGLVLCVRQYCVASYRVSTQTMEKTLHKGDCILVNKLPIKGNPEKGRSVLFSSPLQQDTLHAPLLLGRCIAMPGDTIVAEGDGYFINGRLLPNSPRTYNTYIIDNSVEVNFMKVLHNLNIPLRDRKIAPNAFFLKLTLSEESGLRQQMDTETSDGFRIYKNECYTLVVPRKGIAYRLDTTALTACKDAISRETKNMARFDKGKLYLDGRETSFFYFDEDYYWILSDNSADAVDSRHLGFIPRSHIVGNILFCWYSKDKQHFFKRVN
jgi:signal peptidase I